MNNATTITPFDMSRLLSVHDNKWVALSPEDGSVLAAGETLAEVQETLEERELPFTPVFHKVLPFRYSFAPSQA